MGLVKLVPIKRTPVKKQQMRRFIFFINCLRFNYWAEREIYNRPRKESFSNAWNLATSRVQEVFPVAK